MAGLFDKLEREAFRGGIQARTKESMRWFRTRVSQIKGVNRNQLMKDARNRKRFIYGDMYMYMYDPKHKRTLPYYDRFPLTIPVEPAKGGFRGINLHYLPPVLRAKFLDALLNITNNKKYDESTKFNLTYDLLNGSRNTRYFKPCFKHYLLNHVKSRFAEVPAPEWEIATFLPTAQWEKSTAGRIYSDSRKIANG